MKWIIIGLFVLAIVLLWGSSFSFFVKVPLSCVILIAIAAMPDISMEEG